MAFLNKVLLIGNMTRDPELQYTSSGTAICKFDIAINRKWKDNQETTFLRIESWGKMAEFCKQYFKQGRSIFVEGRIRMDQWEAKDGTKRKQYVIVAEQLGFADSKGVAAHQDAPAAADEPASEDVFSDNNNEGQSGGQGGSGVSDDIPF